MLKLQVLLYAALLNGNYGLHNYFHNRDRHRCDLPHGDDRDDRTLLRDHN